MPFEALAHVGQLTFKGVPPQWSPLVFPFDADLPLFPLLYFHVLPNNLEGQRPQAHDRAYGYIRAVTIDISSKALTAEIICNKNISSEQASAFLQPVTNAVANRLGIADQVTLADITNVFPPKSPFADRIAIMQEAWHRVVGFAYGGSLPFGRIWDPVWGLARAYASFYSPSGRKSEVIQTHYFCTRLGEPVASSEGVPFVQFHLLPTWEELTDTTNPLSLFPRFSELVRGSNQFCSLPQFTSYDLTNWSYTGLKGKGGSTITTEYFKGLVSAVSTHYQRALLESFNAFDKGPVRSLIFLMFLNDVRQIKASSPSPAGAKKPRLNPGQLSASDAADIAFNLHHQQSKKVVSIYSQQAHGNRHCFPMDTWIAAILAHPLAVADSKVNAFISSANNLGKVERLLWVTAQARKIHSAACDDALWCIKASGESRARGANPLACRACLYAIRNTCPAFSGIEAQMVGFNGTKAKGAIIRFNIVTSAKNNSASSQKILSCTRSDGLIDSDTTMDSPSSFSPYPASTHPAGRPMTVKDFVNSY